MRLLSRLMLLWSLASLLLLLPLPSSLSPSLPLMSMLLRDHVLLAVLLLHSQHSCAQARSTDPTVMHSCAQARGLLENELDFLHAVWSIETAPTSIVPTQRRACAPCTHSMTSNW